LCKMLLPDLVQQKISLRWTGTEWIGLCPFHEEKTPSFRVNGERFHCFGCGAHGNATAWLMRTEGLSFTEAKGRVFGYRTDLIENSSETRDYGTFADRVAWCRERLPYEDLLLALVWSRIGRVLERRAFISLTPIGGEDEIPFLMEYYHLGRDEVAKYEALKIWELLVERHWIPFVKQVGL